MVDGVVKVDKDLLEEVEEFVRKNKFVYSSKKQVVNLAIIEFLKLETLKKNKKRGKK